MRASHVALIALVGLAACSTSDKEPRVLHELRTFSGEPEEFGILPSKELVQPESYSALPSPTPGGSNRVDLTPKADLVAALGGNPARLQAGEGIGAGDAALVKSSSRFGRDDQIKAKLKAEDKQYRRTKGRFTWSLLPRDDYNYAYRRQSLEPYAWMQRYRRAGAQTPAAPPE
ncbi:MAG: DUF3035 domain-containing protein [Pelagimonas sp.]|nr:DUF3035 domain-containing protein [Pelagimonas sp.]